MKTNSVVTIKKICDPFKVSKDAKKAFCEIILLEKLGEHPNIIFLKNVIRSSDNRDLYLIFEFVETNLYSICKTELLTNDHKKFISYQLFKVVKYIHSAGLIHRDLKPTNILISKNCELKLRDFGLSKLKEKEEFDFDLTDYVSLRYYRAPEILLGSKVYNQAVDLWAIGCIISEMYTGKILFQGNSVLKQLELILKLTGKPSDNDITAIKSPLAKGLLEYVNFDGKIDINELLQTVPKEATDLISKLLIFDPDKRITCQEALKSNFFKEFSDPEEEIEFIDDLIDLKDIEDKIGIISNSETPK